MTDKNLIDCHVHLAALPDGDNGCYISPKMLRSPLFLWDERIGRFLHPVVQEGIATIQAQQQPGLDRLT